MAIILPQNIGLKDKNIFIVCRVAKLILTQVIEESSQLNPIFTRYNHVNFEKKNENGM